MNSIMERFFRTVKREALDNFLLLGRDQIQGILQEYVAFYNTQRPHQGIRQQIPKPGEPERTAVPSARVLCSADYTTAIFDTRHDVRNMSPLWV